MTRRFTLVLLLALPFTLTFASSSVQPQTSVNFAEHVAPIVFNRCASCHRPGEAGPFPLLTFEDVRKRGKLIATVTQSRYMPPWQAVSEIASFRDDRRLTDAQIRTIQEWVEAGMLEGDPKKIPAVPTFTPGWQLGRPD